MAVSTEAREAQVELLSSALDSLMESEGFGHWLKVRQSFRKYSFNNQILIALQKPEASYVAGFNTWKKLGRRVTGGKGCSIKIFAPCRYKVVEDDGTERQVVRGFKLVSVFDVSDTDGDPLPELAGLEQVTGEGTAALWAALDAYCAQLGFTLSREELRPGLGGYCQPVDKRIALTTDPGFTEAALIRVYIHELVHATGLDYRDFGRQDCEILVDAATCLVLQTLGLDSIESSAAYLAAWADGDRDKAKEWLGHACQIASMIENHIEAWLTTKKEN